MTLAGLVKSGPCASFAASSFCVQGGETHDRVGAHPGPRGPGGHLSMAAGITRLQPRPVHLLPHGEVRVLAADQPAALGQLPRLPPAGLQAMSGKARRLTRPIQRAARLRPAGTRSGGLSTGLRAPPSWCSPWRSSRPWHGRRSWALASISRSSRALHNCVRRRPSSLKTGHDQTSGWCRLGGYLSRWPAPGGREKSGMLEAVTTPAISGAAAGTRVLVWLNRLGQPAAPPPGRASTMVGAVLVALAVAAGIAAGLLLPYRLCRLALDRRRLAAWESAWASTGPRWSHRR